MKKYGVTQSTFYKYTPAVLEYFEIGSRLRYFSEIQSHKSEIHTVKHIVSKYPKFDVEAFIKEAKPYFIPFSHVLSRISNLYPAKSVSDSYT